MSDDDHDSSSSDGPWRPGSHDSDEAHEGEEHEDGAHEAVEKGGEIAKKVGELIHKINEGDEAGALGTALGAGAGALGLAGALVDDEDAQEAVEAAETVAELTENVYEGATHAFGHEGGQHAGEHSAGEHSAGEHEALTRGAAHGAVDHAQGHGIAFHLEVSGVQIRWQVLHAVVHESLGAPFSVSLEARMEDGFAEEAELLGKRFTLSIERGATEQRVLRGLVRQCRVEDLASGHGCQLVLAPSLWLLGLGSDSRIFQGKTVPEVVTEVVQGALGDACTVVTDQLTETYETHEYLVQFQESTLAFVTRLLEQEGIFFAIDCDTDDRESLVLFDTTSNLPTARAHDDGRVPYRNERGLEGEFEEEHAFELAHTEEVAPAAVTVGHYDWTNPTLTVRSSRRGESRVDPPIEIYDHTDAATLHRYADPQYGHNTAEAASLARHQLVMQSRDAWSVNARVVSARPGTVIRLEGSPHDGRYLIVSAESSGEARDDAEGHWQSRLELHPVDLPYRPPVSTPRPVIPGPETAVVVGPAGEEIHCDEHGRVKVHFHWDRLEAADSERSSCWIRVSQSWAGPGFGTFFLPRIGMEVVVSFLGGNPDRPLVTGCVYNGLNRAQFDEGLPANKTQSYIRTKSSLDSDGYNELRFEDKAGSERVFVHAEKDLDEVVEHCHTTHVRVDQSNTVDHDHTETVGNDQTLLVKGYREKTVEQSETTEIQADRTETVFGREAVNIKAQRRHHMEDDDITVVDKHRTTQVGQKYTITSTEQYKVVQNLKNELFMDDCLVGLTIGRIRFESGDGVKWVAEPSGVLSTKVTDKWELEAGSRMYVEVGGKAASLEVTSGGRIHLEAQAEIQLSAGKNSFIKLTPSGIEIEGPSIKVNASAGVTEIDASSQVKIKC